MMIKYLPILKAKAGEFKALEKMSPSKAREMLPLFEIVKIGENTRKAKRFSQSKAITKAYIDEVASDIAQAWPSQTMMADTFAWPADSKIETGEHVVSYLFSTLLLHGLKPKPVVGYDRWGSLEYREALRQLAGSVNGACCVRLDSSAIDDSLDEAYFHSQLSDIVETLQILPSSSFVLLDFGDLTSQSLESTLDAAKRVIRALSAFEFQFISIAGCSLPTSIDQAIEFHDSTGTVLRKEMLLWQTLSADYPNKIVFGDYGVRGPNSAVDIVTPDANGKIRYTVDKNYFIARGHSMRRGNKGEQMFDLAKNVAQSPHFFGEAFSWGDERLLSCSNREWGPGNSTNWISIDTNHHIAFALEEIREYELIVNRIPVGANELKRS